MSGGSVVVVCFTAADSECVCGLSAGFVPEGLSMYSSININSDSTDDGVSTVMLNLERLLNDCKGK